MRAELLVQGGAFSPRPSKRELWLWAKQPIPREWPQPSHLPAPLGPAPVLPALRLHRQKILLHKLWHHSMHVCAELGPRKYFITE